MNTKGGQLGTELRLKAMYDHIGPKPQRAIHWRVPGRKIDGIVGNPGPAYKVQN